MEENGDVARRTLTAEDRAKAQESRSYNAYLAERQRWAQKGYTMYEAVSRAEFRELYLNAKDLGLTHIARTLGQADRLFTQAEAREIIKRTREAINDAERAAESLNRRATERHKHARDAARRRGAEIPPPPRKIAASDIRDASRELLKKYPSVKAIIAAPLETRKKMLEEVAEVHGWRVAEAVIYG